MSALRAFSLVLAVPAVVSVFYFPLATLLLGRWLRKRPARPGEAGNELFPPVTFFRPLKAGVPELAAKLDLLARAMRPGDQLLIGAEDHSAEWTAAEALRRTMPDREISVVACVAGTVANPKIAKLVQMEPYARHDHWILSDSEAMIDEGFLLAFRREWMHCDVLTAGYRFRGMSTWPQRLDAAAILLVLWPGLAVLRRFGSLRLTLGACTGFRRGDLEAVGGWSAFGEELAEDNRLGKTLAATGRTIRLSDHVVTLDSDPLSWRDYWRHQRRVAVTYRVVNPAGFAGSIVTHGVTAGLLLAVCQPTETWAWALFAGVFAVRCLTIRRSAQTLDFPITALARNVLAASLTETVCWVLSWGTRRVWWSGRYRRISWTGRLLAEPAKRG